MSVAGHMACVHVKYFNYMRSSIVTELMTPCVQTVCLSSEYETLLHQVIREQIREGGHFWFTATVVCNKTGILGQELFGITISVHIVV
jgi:hypothetical protein